MYLCVPLDPVLEAELTGEGMTLQEVLDAVTAAREVAAKAAEQTNHAVSDAARRAASFAVFSVLFLL